MYRSPDLAIAIDQIADVERWLAERFEVKRFAHRVNVSAPGSKLRVQFQTDPRYSAFVDRAATHDVLDLMLPVARAEDVLQGKVWAALDFARRVSKRQKDLADIARLIEAYPNLRNQAPPEILARLL